MSGLFQELKSWREEQARKEGVELYRVMPNAALEEIARILPSTRDELMSVKGIKEAKFRKYGAAILKIISETESGDPSLSSLRGSAATAAIQGNSGSPRADDVSALAMTKEDHASDIMHPASAPDALSVSRFLDGVNLELSGMAARVRGEVSSVDERDRVTYFSIKDGDDGSTLPCLIFRSAYFMSGVRLSVGDEVIVEGNPEIWKPMGKLSFKCGFIEYAGEGALKKAYDALLAKLTTEGLLAPERKREIPAFPTRVALLTSRDGAAIGDFMMNVGRHGYRIDLFASSVEGARAVPELLSGLRYFRKHADRYDVLAVIRGGGSLESLQAFNNEALVRDIASFPIPVIAGIGHEKDITLATLVADAGVSTPTAASRLVRQSWEEGAEQVGDFSYRLRSNFSNAFAISVDHVGDLDRSLSGYFQVMKERIRTIVERFLSKRETLQFGIRSMHEKSVAFGNGLKKGELSLLSIVGDRLSGVEALLKQFDPTRALRLGYSLVRLESGKVLRSSKDATVGDMIDIRFAEGGIEAEVRNIL
ncbi:MAG: exodeoxyribonuclease VII large subunit [Candidatus Moranbacteria bacterium]|nr:exodeoxyribonuclease VII large subunit [Candidatus Moranbacteria bacterium]